jgi:hypothetical protein
LYPKDLSDLKVEDLLYPKVASSWRVVEKEPKPQPQGGEVVVLKSHIDCGFSFWPYDFLSTIIDKGITTEPCDIGTPEMYSGKGP